jgi:hypothetical protein
MADISSVVDIHISAADSPQPIDQVIAIMTDLTFTKVDSRYKTEWKVNLNGRPFGLISYEKPRPGETTFYLCTCLHLQPSECHHSKTLVKGMRWMREQADSR